MSTLYILLGQSSIHHPIQSSYIIAKMFEDATDDTIASAVYLQSYLCFILGVCIGQHIYIGYPILECDAAGNFIKVRLGQRLVQRDMIYLFYFVLWMGQLLGQIAIVGQQQHAGGIAIQTSYREDPFGCGLTDKVEDGLTPLRIVGGGDIVLWLVQKYIDKVAGYGNLFAIDLHDVVGGDLGAGLGDELTVDLYFSLANEFGSIATGTDATVGNVFVQGQRVGVGGRDGSF